MEELKKEVTNLTEEELKALTTDLEAVLEKHNAQMGTSTTINLMKVVTKDDAGEAKQEDSNT